MFRKLFTARSSRPLASPRSHRLELEILEDRLPPASLGGSLASFPSATGIPAPISAPYPGSPSFLDSDSDTPDYTASFTSIYQVPFGLSPQAYIQPSLGGLVSSAIAVDGVDTSGLIPASAGSAAGAVSSLAQVQQWIGALYQIAAIQNLQAANALVIDELFAAAGTYTLSLGPFQPANTALLQGNLTAHQNSLAQNPLQQTPVGQMLGTLVFNATYYALASTNGGV